ncbi:MAG: UbiD family decarboxylase [Candidatus Diapherotrites archaeon]|nr:UbiD family decarboxylase [Candidatus Diapherotrites archaeon]
MNLEKFVETLEKKGKLTRVKKPVSKMYECSAIMKELDGKPVLFEKVKESKFRVLGNAFASKELVAEYFGIKPEELVPKMIQALENPKEPEVSKKPAPCQEVVEEKVDLDILPITRYTEIDGGNFITSGVFIARDKELGINLSFHRCMQLDKTRFSVRVLERHTMEFMKRNGGELDVAVCVGLPANVLLAGATSPALGESELKIANSLEEMEVVKAKTVDVPVPVEAEFVLEGILSMKKLEKEGPFLDLTGTYDFVREQPVFTVKKITHKKNAIWHALLPGGGEHRVLMGMPREPTIFREASKVAKVLDVNVTYGGCSWLHAAVKIDKQSDEEPKKVIEAAFKGHASLKHAFVVDKDIDILNPNEIEWAMSTRFQADKNLHLYPMQKGSSLDPSADQVTRNTCKAGFDLTMPFGRDKKDFEKVKYPKVELKDFLG